MGKLANKVIIAIIVALIISLSLSLYQSYKVAKEIDLIFKEITTTLVLDVEDIGDTLNDMLQYEDLLTNEKIDVDILVQIYRDLESIQLTSGYLLNNSRLTKEDRLVIDSINRTSWNLRSFLAQASLEETPFELDSCDGVKINSKEDIKLELVQYYEVFNTARGDGKFNGSNDFDEWFNYIVEN
ncbi:hypothetical protein EJF36_03180 [Bacillus sp. HMF5848]|uniref:hypothetical protein n=1 Tax=Bacillus sp. HMF5848 TaxID=2495421 RepID=UPI000F77FDF3|nr:hypothetical protein [Bacillus sp. HMF5848]RSK25980.1 hypothetical protein EJF36_03180 [Bacillus sp. HMF5848]